MPDFYDYYLIIYTIIIFGYLWYRYIFILSKSKENYSLYNSRVSVVIPFYDEVPELLENSVRSVHEAFGEKEIIVVDDGSKSKEAYLRMKKLNEEIPFELIRYNKNRGKRYAQSLGFRKAKGEIIMTIDSDTVIRKDAILNLLKPFANRKVGAVTGQLEVLNSKKNLLTRMQGARYWNAFNFERKSQSQLGAVVCCSGPISMYRKEIIDKVIHEYENQTFLGESCTFGDDRHLTTLILREGYEVKYAENAVGYTMVPETWGKFIRQQIRWKKSWLRESYLVSKFMFKKNKALGFEVSITVFLTFFSIIARVGLIVALFMKPLYILFVIPMLLFMTAIHSLYLAFYKKNQFFYSLIYGFVNAFLVYWLIFVALFTMGSTSWGTR